MKIQIPSIFTKPVARVDGSVKLEFETGEASPKDIATLWSIRNTPGWLLFSQDEFSEEDVPNEPSGAEKGDKTPSIRLRSVLYIYWEQKMKTAFPDFESFYRQFMEKKINEIKSLLT